MDNGEVLTFSSTVTLEVIIESSNGLSKEVNCIPVTINSYLFEEELLQINNGVGSEIKLAVFDTTTM